LAAVPDHDFALFVAVHGANMRAVDVNVEGRAGGHARSNHGEMDAALAVLCDALHQALSFALLPPFTWIWALNLTEVPGAVGQVSDQDRIAICIGDDYLGDIGWVEVCRQCNLALTHENN